MPRADQRRTRPLKATLYGRPTGPVGDPTPYPPCRGRAPEPRSGHGGCTLVMAILRRDRRAGWPAELLSGQNMASALVGAYGRTGPSI